MSSFRWPLGNTLDWPELKPLPDPPDGATLLAMLSDTLTRHVSLPPHAVPAISLWVLGTYCLDVRVPVDRDHFPYEDTQVARIAPLLGIISAEMRSGKTTLLGVLQRLVYKPISASNLTPAVMYRILHEHQPTVLCDEADSFASGALRNVLNAGFSRDVAFIMRVSDGKARRFNTFGCKAIALIGRLPPTVEDRAIIVQMRRKLPQERLQQIRDADPKLFDHLAQACISFALNNYKALQEARPVVPDKLHDRARDVWELLFAISDVAGNGWPAKAREAAVALTNAVTDLPTGTIALLEGIDRAFRKVGAGRLRTAMLIDLLSQDELQPTGHFRRTTSGEVQLASALSAFGVRPKTVRFGDETFKGYLRKDFNDTFARYLPKNP